VVRILNPELEGGVMRAVSVCCDGKRERVPGYRGGGIGSLCSCPLLMRKNPKEPKGTEGSFRQQRWW